MYPPLRRNYKFMAAIAVCFVALYASVSFALYGATSPAAEPSWSETGYPVQSTDQWRVSACKLHWDLIQRYPHQPPQPLHAFLGLDATAKPFSPPYFSDTNAWLEDPLYDQLQAAIVDAYYGRAGALPQSVAKQSRKPPEGTDAAKEDEWLGILTGAAAILSDDDARGRYAREFVPALKNGWLPWNSNTRKLKKLCA